MVKMGTVWDRTVEFLSDNLPLVLPVAIFAIFVPTSITGSLKPLADTGAMPLRTAIAVLSLGFAILQVWGQLAISALAIDPALGARANQVATGRLLPALGVFAVLFLVGLALLVPIVVALVIGGVDLQALQVNAAIGAAALPAGVRGFIIVYVIALLLAALLAAARLAPLTPVVVAERRGLGAIGRAFALTRGLTWRLVGVMLLYGVVAFVAGLAVQTVFGTILSLVAGGEGPITIGNVITAVAVAAVQTGFTVLATVFVAKLYVAVVRQREAA